MNAGSRTKSFGPYFLVAERVHEGEELHHLVAAEQRPPSLLLRRLDWPEGQELRLAGKQRQRQHARMSLDDPSVPRIYELGLGDGQIFELSDYVFGADLRQIEAAGSKLPWSVAASLFRELLQTLTKMRAADCLPHRLLRARNLRFSLEAGTKAAKLCCNRPLPSSDQQDPARTEPAARAPYYGAQLRALTRLLLSISSPADETQRALLLDESSESADVLADHMQMRDLPLDAMSVARIQFGSAASRRWLEKSVAKGRHKVLTGEPGDRERLAEFWSAVFELAREDRAALWLLQK